MALHRPGAFPVTVAAPNPYAQRLLLTKLIEYSRELQNLQTAARDMNNAIVRKDLNLLSNSVRNSQNWLLSLVETQCYIQDLLQGEDSIAALNADILYNRAAALGSQRGKADRALSQRHSMSF